MDFLLSHFKLLNYSKITIEYLRNGKNWFMKDKEIKNI